jgi:hypothetical protein
MKSLLIEAVFIFLLSSALLEGATTLPSGPSVPSVVSSSRAESAQQVRESFSEVTSEQKKQAVSEKTETSTAVKIEATFDGDSGWILAFCFPKPVTYLAENRDGGVFIEFNQSVDSSDLIKVQNDLGYLLKRLANGYNSLFFVPERDIYYQTEVYGSIFILHLYPQTCGVAKSSRLLKIALARFFLEKRDYSSAFRAICPLVAEYPDDRDVLVLLSALEALLPRWLKSAKILAYLARLYPTDQDVRFLFADTITPHLSCLSFETDMKRTIHFAIEHYYWVRGEQLLCKNFHHVLYLGEEYGVDRAHVSSRLNSQGEGVGFLGNRSQSKIYLRNEWEDGSSATLKCYFTEGVVFGAGLETTMLWPKLQGTFSLFADWHKPYWEIFETIASFGREDRLKFRVTSVYNRWIDWNFEGGIHRVGIRHVPNGFYSLLASGDVFLHWLIPNPIFSLNYDFNAEYVQHETVRHGVNGPFTPVPLKSYEFHTLRPYFYYLWRKYWSFNAFAGETFNRLGTHAATWGISIDYFKPCPRSVEFEIGYFHYPSATVENANVDYVSARLAFRY